MGEERGATTEKPDQKSSNRVWSRGSMACVEPSAESGYFLRAGSEGLGARLPVRGGAPVVRAWVRATPTCAGVVLWAAGGEG